MSGKLVSAVFLAVLVSALFLRPAVHLVDSGNGTWIVDDDGPADFHRIQQAINAASESDIISVRNGTYYENVVVNKSISLIGESNEETTIDGSGTGFGVLVTANDVNISDFTIKNSGEWEAGLELSNVKSCRLSRNVVSDNHFGIVLHRSTDNILRDNQMFFNDFNFYVDAWTPSEFVNDIDSSNLVNGQRIYYWINRHDENVPSDAGHVTLLNCTNIKANRLILTKNYYGILLVYTSNTSMINNRIEKNFNGITQWHSPDNTVTGNFISENWNGIIAYHSDNNTISLNQLNNNYSGLTLAHSTSNTLRLNDMTRNIRNFRLLSDPPFPLQDFTNDIDTSNTIEGKPIYYLLNQNNLTIDAKLAVGYLGVINSKNINVKDIELRNNEQGILFAYTNDSTIEGVRVSENSVGISLRRCDNIKIDKNTAINNTEGILVSYSESNILTRNTIARNGYCGIWLYNSSNNLLSDNIISESGATGGGGIQLTSASENNRIVTNNITNNGYDGVLMQKYPEAEGEPRSNIIAENNIEKNGYESPSPGAGIDFYDGGTGNTIYHNNFVNNRFQVFSDSQGNAWENGLEGNYWSNYTGVDLNNDGIGDTSHVLDANNADLHPLMGMFSSFNTSSGQQVELISNSRIENSDHSDSNKTIQISVSNMTTNQAFGFIRVCIPHGLVNVNNISVIIDNGSTQVLSFNYTLYDNGTHRWIYFAYPHSTSKIDIIPEFSTLMTLPLLIAATLLATLIHRRKHTAQHA